MNRSQPQLILSIPVYRYNIPYRYVNIKNYFLMALFSRAGLILNSSFNLEEKRGKMLSSSTKKKHKQSITEVLFLKHLVLRIRICPDPNYLVIIGSKINNCEWIRPLVCTEKCKKGYFLKIIYCISNLRIPPLEKQFTIMNILWSYLCYVTMYRWRQVQLHLLSP